MNSQVQQTQDTIDWSEVVFLTFIYALYLLFVTAPIGAIISAIKVYRFKKLAEQEGAQLSHEQVLIATHHEWLARSFVVMIVLLMVALGTLVYMLGYAVFWGAVIWWFYRVFRGIGALIAHKEMPAQICTRAQCYGQVNPA
ncbi:hypothetical protein Tel_06770 [Candidatus Tenderia electrophaga]|jgi:uncharacterized membrane protein|uniref:Uncharacterized protein n=1 Tax=Candidatus Tenderia electrophaga TaxID=1748243 RepID=A0A0S2TCM6_9GAMM|nr:hypothetical protein Tel_06770 [Candidatus Tenderia electrophaga]